MLAIRFMLTLHATSMQESPITQVLKDLRNGGEDSVNQLLPLVYDELRRLANSYLSRERANHTLQPTALVHEAYLKLLGHSEIDWQDRAHFFGICARLMRQILIDHARGKNRQKRGSEFATQIVFGDGISFPAASPIDVIAVDEALARLEVLDERQARIVELKFFGGLTVEEIGEVLTISPATVKREWSTAKLFLYRTLDAPKAFA